MNYFKSIVKNVYQKVVQDQYLQQISQQELYYILNNTTRRRNLSLTQDSRKRSISQPQKDLFQRIDLLSNITPQRQFRILGVDPKVQIIKARYKDIFQDLDQVTDLMKVNFYKYQKKINLALGEIDNLKSLYNARKLSMELRTKLHKLQQASSKSKKITVLNIKIKNIKLLLKTLGQIPNIKKMSLTELKSINIQHLKNRSTLNKLNSLSGIDKFIDHAVTLQLSQVLHILEECLINKFQENLYQNALKDFIIAQHQTIKYQKLLIKIVQKQIRKIDVQVYSNLYQICQFYIRLMINLHGVFRWHRLNQKQQKWQLLSKGYYGISIQININNITKKLTGIMDQCLRDTVLQKFYHSQQISQNLQNLYLMCRISSIAYTFSGQYFNLSLKQATQYLYKKLQKQKQKASNQLQQTLKQEQKNNWNRLPVVDDYSHQVIDKTVYQIYRHRESKDYWRVMGVLKKCKGMFKDVKVMVGGGSMGMAMGGMGGKEGVEGNLWDSLWVDVIQRQKQRQQEKQKEKEKDKDKDGGNHNKNGQTKQQNNQHQPHTNTQHHQQSPPLSASNERQHSSHTHTQQQQQNWQIEKVSFPYNQKYQKYKSQIKFKIKQSSLALSLSLSSSSLPSSSSIPSSHQTQSQSQPSSSHQSQSYTIICQYSLTILKYIQIFIKNLFYYPIQPILSFNLSTISLILQYYVYHIFNSLLSMNLKYIFFQPYTNLTTIQQKYHKKRLHIQYPNVSKFIYQFKRVNKLMLRQSVQVQGMQKMSAGGGMGAGMGAGGGSQKNINISNILKHSNTFSYQTSISSSSSSSLSSSINLQNSNNNSQNNQNNLIKQNIKQNMIVRSRVVALESFKYLILYYEHIMKFCGITSSTSAESVGVGNKDKDKQKGNGHIFDIKSSTKQKQTQLLFTSTQFQSIPSQTSQKQINNPTPTPTNLSQIYPTISSLITQKLHLYKTLYLQLSQLIYTDCIPKLSNLKNTHSLIQSIKWNDNNYNNSINQYLQLLSKNCIQFYYKLNSTNRGQVPQQICDRLFGVYWKTQLTAIMKAFINCYKPNKKGMYYEGNSKNKLQKFIDDLYTNISIVVTDKLYTRVPYEKIKAIFPILMENQWENTFQLLKITLERYEFVYAVEMGLFMISESCCYLGNDDLEDRRKIVEDWIVGNLLEKDDDVQGQGQGSGQGSGSGQGNS